MIPAERMLALFNPATHAHGEFKTNGAAVPGVKRKGDARTEHAPITFDMMLQHLEGTLRIGGVPIHKGSNICFFGAIDIDRYIDLDHAALARKVKELKLPLIVCKSKSCGAHLYAFVPGGMSAAAARAMLEAWAAKLGYTNVEIFPKQSSLNGGDVGNWINLPYHGPECHAVDAEGHELSLEEFLDVAERSRQAPAPAATRIVMDEAASVLAPHWHSGQRDNLTEAVYGTLLRRDRDVEWCDGLIRRSAELAGDEEIDKRVRGIVIEARLNAGRKVAGFKTLEELVGKDDGARFLKACGVALRDAFAFDLTTPIPAAWLDEAPPPLTFTVDGLIPRRSVALVVAEGGTGKTLFGLRLAVCVAAGRPFFGLNVAAGRVVYLGMEDQEDSARRRIHWIARCERERMMVEKAPPEAIDAFRDALLRNLTVRSLVGHEIHLVQVYDGQAVQAAATGALIEKLPRPMELLILDPYSRLNGAEENSNAVGTAMINAGERIAREAECTVVVSHHTGKASAAGRDVSLYAARGASGLADAARSVIRLLAASVDEVKHFSNVDAAAVARGDIVRAVHAKCNDAPRRPDFWLRRQAMDFELWVPDGGATPLLERLYGWWRADQCRPFTRQEVTQLRKQIWPGLDVSRDDARALLATAERAGDLVPADARAKHSTTAKLRFPEGWDPHAV